MTPRAALLSALRRAVRAHASLAPAMYALGCLSVLAFPLLSRQTFIDENAFLLGQASIGFGSADARASLAYADRGVEVAMDAARNAAGGASLAARRDAASDALLAWARVELEALGMDVSVHDFEAPRRAARGDAAGGAREGRNLHAVARAAGAPGREGIVFATPIGARVRDRGDDAIDSGLADDAIDSGSLASLSSALAPDADALGFLLAFFSRLARSSPWLAKDVVFLALDARVDASGGVSAADAWLREYHRPRPALASSADRTGGGGRASAAFARAGALQQAYVLELPAAFGRGVPSARDPSAAGPDLAPQFHATILPEGRDGALPNFDLVNLAANAARSSGFARAGLEPPNVPPGPASRAFDLFLRSTWSKVLGVDGGRWTRNAARYVAELERVGRFAGRRAVGAGTGAHASFATFAVDAVTLRARRFGPTPPGAESSHANARSVVAEKDVVALGRTLESLARASNNLVEQLHHSTFYYVSASDDAFLSIAEYVAPQALCLAAMLLAALGRASETSDGSVESESGRVASDATSSAWGRAAGLSLASHAAGAFAAAVSIRAEATFGASDPRVAVAATVAMTIGAFACERLAAITGDTRGGLSHRKASQRSRASALEAVTLGAPATALAALTFFNFPLAFAAAASGAAPACLLACLWTRPEPEPGKRGGSARGSASSSVRRHARFACSAVAAPFAAAGAAAAAAAAGGVGGGGREAFWTWAGALAASRVDARAGRFPLPLWYGVAWPAFVMCALVVAERERGGRGGRAEGKKER